MKNKFISSIIFLSILMSLISLSSVSAITESDCFSGGNITINGTWCVNTFRTNGTFVVTGTINVVTLLVGGGGGGGNTVGGGGGAGGLIYNSSYTITANSYNIVVGYGGAGDSARTGGQGENGTNSSFGVLQARGGGGGGGYNGVAGASGGSGGGGGGVGAGGGSASPSGQGNNGGTAQGNTNYGAGGGGGAGAVGQAGSSNTGGNGGAGLTYTINGTSVCYAGGGGGGAQSTRGTATCGGGNGGDNGANPNAQSGTNGLGGGGGGTRDGSDGGNGGNGVVIITYAVLLNSNVTITAKSYYNNATINIFNVTGNHTGNTTTGTIITTNVINGSVYNYNIIASGFTTNSTSKNDTFTAYLQPLGFSTPTINLSYTNLLIGNNNAININCNATDDMGYGFTTTYYINNSEDGTIKSQLNGTYILQNGDFNNTLNFKCQLNNTWYAINTSTTSIAGIDKVVTLRAVNYLSNLISSVFWNLTSIPLEYTGNPYSVQLSSLTNYSGKNITLNITDLTYRNKDLVANTTFYNENTSTINYTLTPNKLNLAFFKKGNAFSTNGEITDINKTMRFTNSTLVVIQQDLASGYVKVVFGFNAGWTNWTQFYEYKNDFETHISEDIEILDVADWIAYFAVRDKGNSPIKDAKITAYFTNITTTNTWVNYTIIGQRLTGDDGKSFFLFDSGMYAKIRVTAEGYIPYESTIRIGDEDAQTKALSIPIYLEASTTGVKDEVWTYLPTYFTNRSLNIKGSITAPSRDEVKITTSYRNSIGLANRTLTEDAYDRYYFTLTSGSDFSASGTDDIVVYIYVDGKLTQTRTITYQTSKTDIFSGAGLNYNIAIVLAGMILIIFSGIVGFLTTSPTAGFNTFMVGGIAYTLITWSLTSDWSTGAMIMGIISVIYFVSRWITRVVKE